MGQPGMSGQVSPRATPPEFQPPDTSPIAGGGEGPLSAEQLRQLQQADLRAGKLRKAGGLAMFNGVTIACFAVVSAAFWLASLLFGRLDVPAAVMAAGLGVVAFHEFKGRRLLRNFDRRAPRLLGWNQVGLMALLIGYCAWQIADAALGPNPYADAIARQPVLARTLGPIGRLYMLLTLTIYGGVIVATTIFQGLNALYYFTRAKLLAAYVAETPEWILALQRRAPAA